MLENVSVTFGDTCATDPDKKTKCIYLARGNTTHSTIKTSFTYNFVNLLRLSSPSIFVISFFWRYKCVRLVANPRFLILAILLS